INALESLLGATPRPDRVVVVDNGSGVDSVEQIKRWAAKLDAGFADGCADGEGSPSTEAWLTLLCAGRNLGFAGGNNVGLRYLATRTQTTHFLLLNNDATVALDYFARLSDALEAVPSSGIMGCTIFYFPDTERVWFAGGYEDRRRGVALHRCDIPSGSAPVPTEWVTGCAMLISRALYDAIGGLAECYYPIYCEDSDYSLHARRIGASVMLAPRAFVYHKLGATVGTSEVVPQVAYWQTKHRVFCVKRNYSPGERALAISYLCVAKPARSAMHLLRGERAMAFAICRGLWHGLRDSAA
ncbi:MAG TPA: glycosyltransferase family 2 protein, partial [Gemmatimonadaceae bacterium]